MVNTLELALSNPQGNAVKTLGNPIKLERNPRGEETFPPAWSWHHDMKRRWISGVCFFVDKRSADLPVLRIAVGQRQVGIADDAHGQRAGQLTVTALEGGEQALVIAEGFLHPPG